MQQEIKVLFFFIGIFCSNFMAQEVKVNKKYPLTWVSSIIDDTLVFDVGTKLLFIQNCDPNSPKEIPNGSIKFENNIIKGLKYSSTIFFKDTIVEKTIYNYKGSEIDKVLKLFGMNEKEFIKLGNNHFLFSQVINNKLIYCDIRKKSVMYMEQISIINR